MSSSSSSPAAALAAAYAGSKQGALLTGVSSPNSSSLGFAGVGMTIPGVFMGLGDHAASGEAGASSSSSSLRELATTSSLLLKSLDKSPLRFFLEEVLFGEERKDVFFVVAGVPDKRPLWSLSMMMISTFQ